MNGDAAPLWVLITRTDPCHINIARAAFSTSSRSGMKAASSITMRPCLPRSAAARLGSPTMRRPEANVMR